VSEKSGSRFEKRDTSEKKEKSTAAGRREEGLEVIAMQKRREALRIKEKRKREKRRDPPSVPGHFSSSRISSGLHVRNKKSLAVGKKKEKPYRGSRMNQPQGPGGSPVPGRAAGGGRFQSQKGN